MQTNQKNNQKRGECIFVIYYTWYFKNDTPFCLVKNDIPFNCYNQDSVHKESLVHFTDNNVVEMKALLSSSLKLAIGRDKIQM